MVNTVQVHEVTLSFNTLADDNMNGLNSQKKNVFLQAYVFP